jgi:7-carboxy-7-deazaguanine synthase
VRYHVKEIFYSIQGEGANAGRPAVFCRFVGCNLWSGREQDRSSAVCQFCDTDFLPDGALGTFTSPGGLVAALLHAARRYATLTTTLPLLIFTGGEPALQVDARLIECAHAVGFEIAIETNGTRALPDYIDWVCVSPKAGAPVHVTHGHELKFVYPQEDLEPADFEAMEFRHFFVQPMDGPDVEANTRAAMAYCLAHPQWRLSLQLHKFLGVR